MKRIKNIFSDSESDAEEGNALGEVEDLVSPEISGNKAASKTVNEVLDKFDKLDFIPAAKRNIVN